MTLDEAIMRYKSNAEYEREHGSPAYLKSEQLCKWLEELRAYRKIYHKEHEDDRLKVSGVDDGTFAAKVREAYNNGLNDAWECAKKIVTDTGLNYAELAEIFGYTSMDTILTRFSASEAIDRIKKYEDEQKKADGEIHVGDEIYCLDKNHKSIVVGFTTKDLSRCLVMSERGFLAMDTDTLHKTGRTYPVKEMFEELNRSEEE